MSQSPSEEELQRAVFSGFAALCNTLSLPQRLNTVVEEYWSRLREKSTNPLVKCSAKYFSQNDEDGILLEICRRIGLERGVFAELGVGDGLENNSLILLMSGWKGVWLGGESLAFEIPAGGPLHFQRCWITREEASELLSRALSALGEQKLNMLSIDLDGNDLHVASALLAGGIAPDVVIVEYNGKFPPPIRWSIAYDPAHDWDRSDYTGASLQSFVDELAKHGYRLVACNLSGLNAFFVHERHAARFKDVPGSPAELFMPAEYTTMFRGHHTSPKTVLEFLRLRG